MRTSRKSSLEEILAKAAKRSLTVPGLPLGIEGPTAWVGAPFTANWKNYEAGFAKCSYRKGADGRVYLQGLAQPTATGQHPVFTLPVGFRPPLGHSFACAGSSAGTGTNYVRVDVRANGEVEPLAAFAGTSGEFYLFLDTISFFTD